MESVPVSPPDLSRPPLLASRYVVKSRLGRGGTCSAYLVYDLTLRTWRAVKVMHAAAAQDLDLRIRFVREAVAMASLDHPNIVRVVDVAQDIEVPYIVMELVEGGSLAGWLKRYRRMHAAVAVDACAQLCAALAEVHAAGIVHRDVKPHNVLVDRTGHCKLTDFGIARLPSAADRDEHDPDDEHITQVGTVMGTASFMAPEQRVDATSVDARADIYAVGATLYTLVTGRAAPDLALLGPTDDKVLILPPMVAPIVLRACAFRPEDRYPDAAAMRHALIRVQKLLGAPPPEAVPLAQDLPPLPSSAPKQLDPGDSEMLIELLETGVITGIYDTSVHGTAPSLGSRSTRPTQPPPQPRPSLPPPPPAVPEQLDVARVLIPIALLVAAATVLLVGGGLFVSAGARDVAVAERAAVEGQRHFEVILDHHLAVVEDLVSLGAERRPLEDAVRAFETASPSRRADAAEALYARIELEAAALREGGKTRAAVNTAMTDIRRSREEYLAAVQAWAAAAGRVNGAAAVLLGLAARPPEVSEVTPPRP